MADALTCVTIPVTPALSRGPASFLATEEAGCRIKSGMTGAAYYTPSPPFSSSNVTATSALALSRTRSPSTSAISAAGM